MKKILMLGMLLLGPNWAFAVNNGMDYIAIPPSVLISSAGSQVGNQVTLLISTPVAKSSYSAGEFNYLTNLHIEAYYAGGSNGTPGSPYTCTSTNLVGTPTWKMSQQLSTGTVNVIDLQFANPARATQASQITVVCPATPNILWNIVAGYFQGI